MSTSVQYSAYTLKKDGQDIVRTDFSQRLEVGSNIKDAVLADLSLDTSYSDSQTRSTLQLELTKQTVTYERSDQGVKLNPQLEVNYQPLVIEAENLTADKNQNKVSKEEVEQLKQQLLEQGGNNVKELVETEEKIMQIQDQLEAQKKADEAQVAQGEVEAQVQTIDEQLQTVEDLINQQQKLKEKLEKYESVIDISPAKLQNFKQQMYEQRENLLQQKAQLQQEQKGQNKHNSKPKRQLIAPWLLVFPVALLLISIFLYFSQDNLMVFLTGLFFSIVLMSIYIMLNFIQREVKLKINPKRHVQASETGTSELKELPQINSQMQNLEKYFIDKAWMEVIKKELETITGEINNKLNGANYDDLKQKKQQLQENIEQLQERILAYEDKNLSPEDYLKQRRELDKLKTQRDRLEAQITDQDTLQLKGQWLEKALTIGIEPPAPQTKAFEEFNYTVQDWLDQPNVPLILVDLKPATFGLAEIDWSTYLQDLQQYGQVIQIQTT